MNKNFIPKKLEEEPDEEEESSNKDNNLESETTSSPENTQPKIGTMDIEDNSFKLNRPTLRQKVMQFMLKSMQRILSILALSSIMTFYLLSLLACPYTEEQICLKYFLNLLPFIVTCLFISVGITVLVYYFTWFKPYFSKFLFFFMMIEIYLLIKLTGDG
jgi:hypothetical protein